MNWYYELNGEQRGPVAEEELKQLFESGSLTGGNLVWREGMTDWAPYDSLFGTPNASTDGKVSCPTCGAAVQADQLIPAGDTQVCPQCRDTYAQGLKEGLQKPVASPAGRGTGGQLSNPHLRAQARQSLAGNWAPGVGITFIWVLLQQVVGFVPFIGFFGQFIISGPLTLGYHQFFLRLVRNDRPEVANLFNGFSQFVLGLGVYFVIAVIVGLSTLAAAVPGGILMGVVGYQETQGGGALEENPLFWVGLAVMVIPAVIVSVFMYIRYSMAYFIANDEPENGVLYAIQKSPQILNGFKKKLFFLFLSFIGWYLLSILTLFIGLLWVIPYLYTSLATFYDDLGEDGSVESSAAAPGLAD